LGWLKKRHVDQGFSKVNDGQAIARLMTEPEIAREIKDLLYRLAE
jgi:hypothetical protein